MNKRFVFTLFDISIYFFLCYLAAVLLVDSLDGAFTEGEYAQLKKELLSSHAMPITSNDLKAIEHSDANLAQEVVEDRQLNEEALKAYEKTTVNDI